MNIEGFNNSTSFLFYGEMEEMLFEKFKYVLTSKANQEFISEECDEICTPLEYWLILSELSSLNLFEYGTSPRGGWLTAKGEELYNEMKTIKTSNEFYEALRQDDAG